ncbi:B3 domain-containing protein [Striga asiatica]|uniref:B3 domain-containing protein n=1 Tax=Striga asiatica TaxID=4170 RepID=A0A5A7QA73_STRAF|nr:B3 domain-containing protein [Striga asiatica]
MWTDIEAGCDPKRLPSALVHQYMLVVPLECTLNTRDGRTYQVTIRRNDERIFFDDGWLHFMMTENIKTKYYLWFDRNSLTDFVVTVVEENVVERPLRYHFTLEIKKTYIERAYLVID